MKSVEPNPQSVRAALFEAMAAQQRGDFPAAISSYRRILERDSRNADAWLHLGIALHRTNEKGSAESAFLRSLTLNPGSHAARLNLGTLYFTENKLAEARSHLEAALQLNRADHRAPVLLGRIAAEENRHEKAIEHFQHALNLKPDDLKLLQRLVRSLCFVGSREEALEWVRLAVDRDPAQMELRVELAMILRALDRYEEAIEGLRAALRENPDHPDVHHNLGALLEERGEFDAAAAAYREALRLKPDHNLALASAIRSRAFRADHPALRERAESLLETQHLQPEAEAFLRYALGKHLDAVGEHERAMHQFHEANALQRREGEYLPEAFTRYVDALIETFAPALIERLAASGSESFRPIFIVGLPRSGTTLIEQILASHSQVAAGGEIPFFLERSRTMFVEGHPGVRYPEASRWLDEGSSKELQEAYLSRLERVASGHAAAEAGEPGAATAHLRVTDKMPFNFQHLGLIRGVFPRAKIIFCRRDPLDNCLSCYFENLTGEFRFAHSLAGLGHHYREHLRLMAHWSNVLGPGGFFEMRYEDLIREFQPCLDALLEYCELPREERCARFFESSRVIATPSNWQVRQPIYSTSVGRWRAYESHLEELRSALAGAAS